MGKIIQLGGAPLGCPLDPGTEDSGGENLAGQRLNALWAADTASFRVTGCQ